VAIRAPLVSVASHKPVSAAAISVGWIPVAYRYRAWGCHRRGHAAKTQAPPFPANPDPAVPAAIRQNRALPVEYLPVAKSSAPSARCTRPLS